jgi:hypothetical protein
MLGSAGKFRFDPSFFASDFDLRRQPP